MAPRPILVIGATSTQGVYTTTGLLALSASNDFVLLAVTDNSNSLFAKALSERFNSIKIIQGDLDDCPALFETALKATDATPIWGVYSVEQEARDGWKKEREEREGKDLIDAALANGVSYFVYHSVARNGESLTCVPRFQSKHNIEEYLKTKAAGKMSYTIFRPAILMEDFFSGDFRGRLFSTWLRVSMDASKPLPFISCKDIGFMVCMAFQLLDAPAYHNQAITLAGDNLTYDGCDQAFRARLGYPMPTTFKFIARPLLSRLIPDMALTTKWYNEVGCDVDIPALKKLHPGLQSLGDWLEADGYYPKKNQKTV